MPKITMNSSVVEAKKPMEFMNYAGRTKEAEIKLKKYMDIVANWDTDFEDVVKNDLVLKVLQTLMMKQDYKKFVTKWQLFQ